MHRHKLALVGFCCIVVVSVGSYITQLTIRTRLQQRTDEDLREIITNLKNAPPAPLRERQTFLPYQVMSNFSVVEVGGPESAVCSFVENNTRVKINVSIHTCRPKVMHDSQRFGELNLVDGSQLDLCTSGGMITIVDPETEEEFSLFFKLIGSPSCVIGWNARQFVSRRTDVETWQQTLNTLHENLESTELSSLPETIRESHDIIETYDASDSSSVLMYGSREEMLILLTFRKAFRDFYKHSDSQNAERIVWLMIDRLLESKTQKQLSVSWIELLTEAEQVDSD